MTPQVATYLAILRASGESNFFTLSESLNSVLSIHPPLFAFSGALFAYSVVLGSSYWPHFLFCCINMSHYSSVYLVCLGELSRPFWSFLLDSGMCGTLQSCIGLISWYFEYFFRNFGILTATGIQVLLLSAPVPVFRSGLATTRVPHPYSVSFSIHVHLQGCHMFNH